MCYAYFGIKNFLFIINMINKYDKHISEFVNVRCRLQICNTDSSAGMGETMKKSSNKRTRKFSIRVKILLVTSVLMIVVVLLLGMSFYNRMNNSMVEKGIEQAEAAAAMAIKQVSGAEIASLKEGAESTVAYKKNFNALMVIKEEGGVAFLYTLSTDGKQVYYGIDTDEEKTRHSIGDVFEED